MLFRERNFADFTATHIETLGAEASYGSHARARATREVLLRLVVEHADREAVDVFARELGSVGLGFSPGTTGIYGGRPKPTPVVRLYTFMLDKSALAAPRITIGQDPPFDVAVPIIGGYAPHRTEQPATIAAYGEPTVDVDLIKLAWARSGDKGDASNIAIIARQPEFVPLLRRELTAERMAAHFAESVQGAVVRFEAPGLNAFNFLLSGALGGGGMASLRIDPQGKAYGQRALEMRIPVPVSLARQIGELT
jgi:hypothetical protein